MRKKHKKRQKNEDFLPLFEAACEPIFKKCPFSLKNEKSFSTIKNATLTDDVLMNIRPIEVYLTSCPVTV